MTISLQELSDYLDAQLPLHGLTDFCPNGLQVEGKRAVSRVAFAVSASLAVIEAAAVAGADALVVHHGIFWNRDSYVVRAVKRRKLSLLLGGELSLFAYHLPLDAHRKMGNNWRAAEALGWKELRPFGPGEIGVQGVFPRVDVALFQKQLEEYYNHPATVALGGRKQVSSAALVAGGAYRSLEEAADAGVDCFVTGNFDEPAWDMAHERKLNFFALGHYATECTGILALREEVERALKVETLFIDRPNPF